MRFETNSGTVYEVEMITAKGPEWPYRASLRRLGNKRMGDMRTGGEIDVNEASALVVFYSMPVVGESFRFWHDEWEGVISTPVKEIFDEE